MIFPNHNFSRSQFVLVIFFLITICLDPSLCCLITDIHSIVTWQLISTHPQSAHNLTITCWQYAGTGWTYYFLLGLCVDTLHLTQAGWTWQFLLLIRMDYCLQWHINSCSVLTYPFLQSADLLFLAVCGCITSYMGYEDISILWGLCWNITS